MKIVKLVFSILVFSYGFTPTLLAQLKSTPGSKIKEIQVKGDRFLFLDEEVFYVANDTIIFVPDTVDVLIRKHDLKRTEDFYKSVEEKMSKSKISSMVYDFIFVSPSAKRPHSEELSELRFDAYRMDQIHQLKFKKLKPFGTRIDDTTFYKPNKYVKQLNNIHWNTRNWVIRKNILFREGDVINPSELVESERLLRRLPFIKDARILVSANGNDDADVVVVTRDVLPYNIEIKPNNANEALFGISHINILGTGHELEYNFVREGEYEFFYKVPNMFGSFIDSQLDYSDHFRKSGLGANLFKPFVTQETKYAGGAEYSVFQFGEYNYDPISDVTSEFFYKRDRRDIWMGRAFLTNLKADWLGLGDNTYAIASFRYDYQDFFDKPIVSPDTNYTYQDHRDILLSIGLSSREYFKDKFILQFGRTEDIPTGASISGILGFQQREFENRIYLGGNYSRGGYLHRFGYLNSIFRLGSFVSSDGLRDGVYSFGMNYFSNLVVRGQYKFRQFVDVSFSQTINPTEDIYLRTQNDLGIRGVTGFYHKATTWANVKYEPILFTPMNFTGFRVVVFGFFDATYTRNNKSDFFHEDLFVGYGAGVRLRNDNLAFSTIQIRFGLYPSVPINGNPSYIDFSTSTRLRIRDFDFQAPEIIPFR